MSPATVPLAALALALVSAQPTAPVALAPATAAVHVPSVSSPAAPATDAARQAPLAAAPRVSAPRGAWAWPLSPQPTIGERFDPPPKPWLAGHRGVDLHAREGQAVLAPAPGRVTWQGVIAGTGSITITHAGGIRTTYQPVVDRLPRGTTVDRGERIGTLGGESHCAPRMCLHWGALTGPREYIDPLTLLGLPPVLLPLG